MNKRSHDPDHPQDAPLADPLATETGGRDITPVEDTHATGTVTTSGRDSRDSHVDDLPDSSGGKLGSAWIGLVLGAIVTILLLVFIVQNIESVDVQYFGWGFEFPLGVLVLLAAIAGALIMAMFAGYRILQLRMRARKTRKIATHQR